MPKTLKDVLAEAGTPMDFESGGHSPSNLVDREVEAGAPCAGGEAEGHLHGYPVLGQQRVPLLVHP